MAKLMVHRQILRDYHKLPSKVQKRVAELIDEFQKDPHSDAIGMHPLKGTLLDPKVRGITKLPDGYRAIVIAPAKGDVYLLVHIDSHDKAYEWAKSKRFEVHEMTGVFQVFDAEEVRSVVDEIPQEPKAAIPDYPLSRFTEDELFAAGVPRPLLPAVRSIHSDEGLEALSDYLPPDCRDVLYGLASGLKLDEALNEMLGETTADAKRALPHNSGDFSKIHESPNFDLVLIEGEEELKKILQGNLEEWRIFLHPYQKKIVTWKTNGPMNISGAAGTRKTVALMHRAVHLARGLEAGGRVLVSTFTTNLSVTIKHHLQRLAADVAEKIEVTNLHALREQFVALGLEGANRRGRGNRADMGGSLARTSERGVANVQGRDAARIRADHRFEWNRRRGELPDDCKDRPASHHARSASNCLACVPGIPTRAEETEPTDLRGSDSSGSSGRRAGKFYALQPRARGRSSGLLTRSLEAGPCHQPDRSRCS